MMARHLIISGLSTFSTELTLQQHTLGVYHVQSTAQLDTKSYDTEHNEGRF